MDMKDYKSQIRYISSELVSSGISRTKEEADKLAEEWLMSAQDPLSF